MTHSDCVFNVNWFNMFALGTKSEMWQVTSVNLACLAPPSNWIWPHSAFHEQKFCINTSATQMSGWGCGGWFCCSGHHIFTWRSVENSSFGTGHVALLETWTWFTITRTSDGWSAGTLLLFVWIHPEEERVSRFDAWKSSVCLEVGAGGVQPILKGWCFPVTQPGLMCSTSACHQGPVCS